MTSHAFLAAALLPLAASAQNISLTWTGDFTSNWTAGQLNAPTKFLQVSPNLGGTVSNSYSVTLFVDDRSAQAQQPFGQVSTAFNAVAASFVRSGSTIDSLLAFSGTNRMFHSVTTELRNGAVDGTDNFLPFRISSSLGGYHYGFLQVELHAYSSGNLAARLVDAQFNSIRNAPITAGAAVPEPSTYGLILGGLALAGAALRRRRKKTD